jgi:hypothetical protein
MEPKQGRKTDKRIESMLRGCEGSLRRMLGFTWEDKISKIRLKELTGLRDINKELKIKEINSE